MNKAKSGQRWSDRFGWLPQAEIARYEQGERLYRGKWMTVAEEAEFRSRIDRGWELITEHFVIRTNHSLEAGAKLAVELEKLTQAWHALFVTFLADEREVEAVVRRQGCSHASCLRGMRFGTSGTRPSSSSAEG